MERLKSLITMVLIPAFIITGISLSFGDSSDYIYDDAGRLLKVLKGNVMLFYQYDEVGNLLSISTDDGALNPLPPSLSAITPDILVAGLTYNAVIIGKNLRTTQSVTSDNQDVIIKNIASIDTKITANISVAGGAVPGQTNIKVTTSYGSASMAVNLYQANITPGAISLFPASTGAMSITLTPPAPRVSIVPIMNKTPDIIEAAAFVAIPAGGAADLTVRAIKEGTGIVGAGSTEALVYVIGGGSLLESPPVCVTFSGLTSGAAVYAQPVSVDIGGSISQSYIVLSNGVSVACPHVINENEVVSAPVSVVINVLGGATIISAPVCVKILQ